MAYFQGSGSLESLILERQYCDLLRVKQDATSKEIKQQYRVLAKRVHPDKNKADPNATAAFQKLNEAYTALINHPSRAYCDSQDAIRESEEKMRKRRQEEARVAKEKEAAEKKAQFEAEAKACEAEQVKQPQQPRSRRIPRPSSWVKNPFRVSLKVKMDDKLRKIAEVKLAAKFKADDEAKAEEEEEMRQRPILWETIRAQLDPEIDRMNDKLANLEWDLAWYDAVDARDLGPELCHAYGPGYTEAFDQHTLTAGNVGRSIKELLERYMARSLCIRELESLIGQIQEAEVQRDHEWNRIFIPEGRAGLIDRDFKLFTVMLGRRKVSKARKEKFDEDKANRENVEEKRGAMMY